MEKVKIKLAILLCTILAGSFAMQANAGLLYNNFKHAGSESVNYIVTVDHDTVDGQFDITYQVDSLSPNTTAKLTGFFFDMGAIDTGTLPDPDTSDPYSAANLGLANELNPSATSVCGMAFGDVNSVSGAGGCNSTLNYGTTIIDGFDYHGFLFDVGLAWKVNDLTTGVGSFSISDLGSLTLDDWGVIGLRGQAVGNDSDGFGGSAKELQLIATRDECTDDCVSVPEPSALILLGLGLAGLGFSRHHRF